MTEAEVGPVRELFAELTGQLEDAAFVATQGQGARSFHEARAQGNALLGAIDRMSVRLEKLKGQIG